MVFHTIGFTPTALHISHNEHTGMLDLHWNSEGRGSCVQFSVYPKVTESWNLVTNASYTLPLINTTYEIAISFHPDMNMVSNFTIGMCSTVQMH